MERVRKRVRRSRRGAVGQAGNLTRRHLVGGALGVAGAAAIGASLARPGGLVAPPGLAAAQEEGGWLPDLWELTAENGLLNLVLVATGDASRGDTALGYALSTDPANPDSVARSPGPTLRLGRGDRLRIHLANTLVSETNLHVHGLHVSPSGNSDNIFVHVAPGADHSSFDFEYQIPENHRSGLFWYHPHLHGTTADQVKRGLAGAIVIEERTSDVAAVRDEPLEVKGVPERLLVLQHLVPFTASERFHVNGAIEPKMRFRPGERERWRLLNASSDTFLNLYLGGLEFHRVAVDGNWLETAVPSTVLPLGPAERAEILIDWGDDDSYALSALEPGGTPVFQFTWGMKVVPLATLLQEDAVALFGATPVPAPEPPTALLPLDDLRAIAEVPKRELEFQLHGGLVINGKGFRSGRVDQTVELGGIEEWQVGNTSPAALGWHPLHIHVNDFQVVSITGNDLAPVWYTDTVPLPPGGHVVLRMTFPDFTGRFVYHCHFLEHEDAGMMGVIDVARPVRISDSTLVPDTAAISVGPTVPAVVNSGTTVVWTNLDPDECRIVADDIDPLTGQPLFASVGLAQGASFAHTFDAPGAFAYGCVAEGRASLPGLVTVAAHQSVEIQGFAFQPSDVTVAVGTTVTWTNRDPRLHTVTADNVGSSGEPHFDTGPIGQLASGTHTFSEAGDFTYHCDIHPGMTGVVRVRPLTRQSVSVGIVDDVVALPDLIEVFKDSTVTWANHGTKSWSVDINGTDDSGPLDPEHLFGEGLPLSPGQRFSHTFSVPGVVPVTSSATDPAATHTGIVRVVQPIELVAFDTVAFEPLAVTIPVGADIAWINRDASAHTVTVTDADSGEGTPIFDSGPFGPGELRRFRFLTSGAFSYRATEQPDLVGTIIVE